MVGKEDNQDRKRALEAALSQIDRAFGKGSVMKLGSRDLGLATDAVSTGSLGLDIALGIGGLPRGRVDRDLRPGILGQDHLGAACRGRGPEKGRHRCLCRCRTCARPRLCQQAGRRYRRNADLPARHGRTGAGDHRHAGALGRRGHRGDRLGGGADAQGRAGRRNGRSAARPAGAADEPGAEKTHRLRSPNPTPS